MTESRNDGMTDRLKTVYPPKTTFCGGYNYVSLSDFKLSFMALLQRMDKELYH